MACDNGPGMQARWHNRATDFFSDDPFYRTAAQGDAAFYATPRLTGHVDQSAATQICELYRRLLPAAGLLLDLMSSMQSHLPAGHAARVTGLGMNRKELDANPQLHERLVHDLNEQPCLPFADAHFDAAVCSLSIEYLIRPFEVFAEVARVLQPGAPFVVTFSDRWFPPKVIRAWEWAHPFERLGIAMEYFLRDRHFNSLHTSSLRGLPRPADDKYAARRDTADPVFAVWGSRA
jgi:SAM-dependent methyltransferase